MSTLGLIADFGGTNARFALCDGDGPLTDEVTLSCADYSGPAEAAEAYLTSLNLKQRPTVGAFCVASPVTGDNVTMTNLDWRFSREVVRQQLGLERMSLLNDFAAVALGMRRLGAGDAIKVGGGIPVGNAPMGVIGPGTGLGVALLIPDGRNGWLPVATEAGHVTMAACDEEEAHILHILRKKFGHVSAERVLSGPGLTNLHAAITMDHSPPLDPATITHQALTGSDPNCEKALDVFFSMLGTVAGNLALSAGALGGVFIAGGILPRMPEAFVASRFRARFESKGRFSTYNAKIPTYLVTHPFPAFLGLAGLVSD